jgi:uncharacterized protein involved in outer membrane biogenesis
MKRKLLIVAIALLLVIVGIFVFLYNNIDPIVESAIEKYGTQIMGTKVSVGSVHISLKSGRGTIRDVSVANPDGFSSGTLFKLKEITVDIDVASLNQDPIVIDEVTIAQPDVLVEMNEQAQSNVSVIKRNVDQYQSSTVPSERKEGGGFEKRFMIEKFAFEEGTVELDATALGVEEAEDLELPPVRLSNVGGPNGDTPDGIGKTVSRAFVTAVTDVVTAEVRARATEKAKQEAGDAAKKTLDKILN